MLQEVTYNLKDIQQQELQFVKLQYKYININNSNKRRIMCMLSMDGSLS